MFIHCLVDSDGDLGLYGQANKRIMVDALAVRGDEGRGSLRKAVGELATSFDPADIRMGKPTV